MVIVMGSWAFFASLSKHYNVKYAWMNEDKEEENDVDTEKKPPNKCIVFILRLVMKFQSMTKLYTRTVLEVVDFSKDCWYSYSVNHVNQELSILLWVFTLFAFSYKILDVVTMTKL